MKHSDSLAELAPALVKALSEIEGVAKAGENPAFKRDGKALKYTTLEAVIEASRDVLAKHDLGLMQFPGALDNGALTLETVILHKSGQWVSADFQIALGKTDPQGVGSALTYARRYAQKAALNIPEVDDDAEAAMGRGHQDGRRDPPQESGAVKAAKATIDMCRTEADLLQWQKDNEAALNKFPDADANEIVRYWKAKRAELKPRAVG